MDDARLRNLGSDTIEGFGSDGTLALDGNVAIVLTANGLAAVGAKKAQESSADVVAYFESERAPSGTVWRVFDPSFAIEVQGERLHQVPFAILGGADVVSRGRRLRLRFEAPFAPVSFGGFIPPMPFEQGTLLNPIIGTAPFFFRAAAESGDDVELMSASYGASGMELREPTAVWRLCTIAEANRAQEGAIPESILIAIAQQLIRQEFSGERVGKLALEDTAITEGGELVEFGAPPQFPTLIGASHPGELLSAEAHRANVAHLIAALDGQAWERNDEGLITFVDERRGPFWEVLRLSPRGRAREWSDAVLQLSGAKPSELARWAAAFLPETTQAQAEANEQIAMMRPLDLFKLRLQSIAANSRAAI